jgi:hypothetical protein
MERSDKCRLYAKVSLGALCRVGFATHFDVHVKIRVKTGVTGTKASKQREAGYL